MNTDSVYILLSSLAINSDYFAAFYQKTPEGSRSVGRPSLRWMDDVREDLRRMGVTNWRIRAHRRDDWKMVVKEAKVLQGL